MPFSSLYNVKITAVSSVVPSNKCCITDDKKLYGGDIKKINRLINSSGFYNRRVCNNNITASDLCMEAANELFKKGICKKSEIDALLFISYTPDYLMPATSYVLHSRLGLSTDCICMDIPQACSGYVIGLFQSAMLINSGCKKVLLLVGDTFSKFTDMFKNHKAPIFGDAGTATIIEYDTSASPMFFNIRSDGKEHDSLICRNGGFRNPPRIDMFYDDGSFKYDANMEGARIFQFAINKISDSVKELLEYNNYKIKDIDYFIFHQANKFIINTISQQLDINNEKVPMDILSEYGNQCGASIPCCMCGSISKVLFNKEANLLLCGFGVGLSWASVIIKSKGIYCSEILDSEY